MGRNFGDTTAGTNSFDTLTIGTATITGTLAVTGTITNSALTASRAMVTDASKGLASSATTATELGYVSGVTSAIQTQLDAKSTSTLTDSYVFVGNVSNVATGVAISGDIGLANDGTVSISSGVIVNADVNASAAIAVSKLAAVTASRVLVSDASGFLSASSVTSTTLGYLDATSSIQTQLDAKTTSTLTDSYVFVGNAFNVATGVAISGDISLGNDGAVAIASGVIVNDDVNAAAAIAGSKISPDFGSQAITTTGAATAARFIPSSSTVPTNGMYLSAANTVGVAVNSALLGQFNSTGFRATYSSSGARIETIAVNTSAGAGSDAKIGATTSGTGSSYAYVELRDGSNNNSWNVINEVSTQNLLFKTNSTAVSPGTGTTRGSVTSAGAWTFGAASTTPVHRFNAATQTTVGAAGGASGLPATPTGYVEFNLNGTAYVLPYYAKA